MDEIYFALHRYTRCYINKKGKDIRNRYSLTLGEIAKVENNLNDDIVNSKNMLGFYHISYERLRLELKHPNKKK